MTVEVSVLTVPRMNREFTEYSRAHFPALPKQQLLKMAVLKPEDNTAIPAESDSGRRERGMG